MTSPRLLAAAALLLGLLALPAVVRAEAVELYSADLKLVVNIPRLSYHRREEPCQIFIVNQGAAPARDIVVEQWAPAGMALAGCTAPRATGPVLDTEAATAGNILLWKFEELLPGETATLAFTGSAERLGVFELVTRVHPDSPSRPSFARRMAWTEMQILGVPSLRMAVHHLKDPVAKGEKTSFLVEISNEGSSPCTMIELAGGVSPELVCDTIAGPVAGVAATDTFSFDAYPILFSGEKLAFRILCVAQETGSAKLTAVLRYQESNQEIRQEESAFIYE